MEWLLSKDKSFSLLKSDCTAHSNSKFSSTEFQNSEGNTNLFIMLCSEPFASFILAGSGCCAASYRTLQRQIGGDWRSEWNFITCLNLSSSCCHWNYENWVNACFSVCGKNCYQPEQGLSLIGSSLNVLSFIDLLDSFFSFIIAIKNRWNLCCWSCWKIAYLCSLMLYPKTDPSCLLLWQRLSCDFNTPHWLVQFFFLILHLSVSICCLLSYICL